MLPTLVLVLSNMSVWVDSQEFYAAAVEELIFTTISGVVAVAGVGFIFFPHWMAIFFVFPLISMLYVNLLGKVFCRYPTLTLPDCNCDSIIHTLDFQVRFNLLVFISTL